MQAGIKTLAQTRLKKIAIVGSSCAGKTTLSKILEERLDLRRIELDAINWQPHWQELDYTEFKEIIARETQANEWIVDGNYNSRMKGLVLQRADTIIWLNLPFLTVYGRLFRRLFHRVVLGEELWNGNRENLYNTFLLKDSLLYWIPRHYWKNQRAYRNYFSRPEHSDKLVEFTDVRSINAWLMALPVAD